MTDVNKDAKLSDLLELFPHKRTRKFQDELMMDVYDALLSKKNILINAPTGVGKTSGVLVPALRVALDNDLKILFLTSRHTQHEIVVKTIKQINKRMVDNKIKESIVVADIVGKKHLCGFDDVTGLNSSDFNEYCRLLRESNKCDFYKNTFVKESREGNDGVKSLTKSSNAIIEFLMRNPSTTSVIKKLSQEKVVCPYEISCYLAKKARVIIADYNHIFNPNIRSLFLRKIDSELSDMIIIVDEAHNLPDRLRSMLSQKISVRTVDLAVREASKFNFDINEELSLIKDFLIEKSRFVDSRNGMNQIVLSNDEIIKFLSDNLKSSRYGFNDVDELINNFVLLGDEVRLKQRKSFIGRIGDFLDFVRERMNEKDVFITILSVEEGKNKENNNQGVKDRMVFLEFYCLDPALLGGVVFNNSFASVLMSATLNPLRMYSDILGVDSSGSSSVILKSYPNPFPKKNRLTLVIPDVTTKYEFRTQQEFERITRHIKKLVDLIPGRSIVFFPSYSVMSIITGLIGDDQEVGVNHLFDRLFVEKQGMSKQDKELLLKEFLESKNGVLFGVVGASFSEGIDLPGMIRGVIIVGLPLKPPDKRTLELIRYYDYKFNKGFDYGYVIPAVNSIIQSAGRAIRSESDIGALVFLDKRYLYDFYKKLFPNDWELVITTNYEGVLKEFFSENNKKQE